MRSSAEILGCIGADEQMNAKTRALSPGLPIAPEKQWTHCALHANGVVMESHAPEGVHCHTFEEWQDTEWGKNFVEVVSAEIDLDAVVPLIGQGYPFRAVLRALLSGNRELEFEGVHCGQFVASCLPGFPLPAKTALAAEIQAWLYEKRLT